MDKITRYLPDSEIRMSTDNGKPVIEIQGIVFDKWSQNLGGFVEIIERSAYNDKTNMSDVRALFNHDANFVIGRTGTAGTMQIDLRSDSLWGIVTPPDTTWMRDLQISMERRDISGASHGFMVDKNDRSAQSWDFTGTVAKRTIKQVSEMNDLSVVTYPAYLAASASMNQRDLESAKAEYDAIIAGVTDEDIEVAIRSGSVGVTTLEDGTRLIVSDDVRFAGRSLPAIQENPPFEGLPLSTYQRRARLAELTRAH